MKALEANVRAIEQDGLVWGLSKLVPVGYGVSKLQVRVCDVGLRRPCSYRRIFTDCRWIFDSLFVSCVRLPDLSFLCAPP